MAEFNQGLSLDLNDLDYLDESGLDLELNTSLVNPGLGLDFGLNDPINPGSGLEFGLNQPIIPPRKTILSSVTGVAETAMGDINKWRTVLAHNPDKLPFNLPPTLQLDIDRLNESIPFAGLKIPPLSSLESDLKKALGSLVNPVLLQTDKPIDDLFGEVRKTMDKINQIDWLG